MRELADGIIERSGARLAAEHTAAREAADRLSSLWFGVRALLIGKMKQDFNIPWYFLKNSRH